MDFMSRNTYKELQICDFCGEIIKRCEEYECIIVKGRSVHVLKGHYICIELANRLIDKVEEMCHDGFCNAIMDKAIDLHEYNNVFTEMSTRDQADLIYNLMPPIWDKKNF